MKAAPVETIREVMRAWPDLQGIEREAASNWLQHQPFRTVAWVAEEFEGFDIGELIEALPVGWQPDDDRLEPTPPHVARAEGWMQVWRENEHPDIDCALYPDDETSYCLICHDPIDYCPGHGGITINGVPIEEAYEQQQAEDDLPPDCL